MVERAGDDFDVHVVDSPAGEAHGTFAMPFGEHELENFVLKMGARRGVRRAGSAPRTAAQAFGQTLYGAVFTPDVEYALRQSLQDCQGRGEGLRVRLRLHNAPELMDVPWEYLHSTALGRPLALSVDTPLVRYMDMGQAVEALEVTPPLRILVVVSSPTDIEQLDTEKELANLREATAELVRDGRIEVHALASPTVADLQHQLRKEAFHILHFMGHGIFDEATGTGMLAFEDDERRARPVPGSDLGMMLHDHRNLQMVVLNACEGARTSVQDPLGGVAQSLARAGIPAVVAMQFEISDAAAKRFSRELYLAIADGYPVDAAVSEARKALYLQDRATEWGTPVLHLRAADGQIFDLKAAPKPAEVPTLMEEVEARAEEDGLGEISAIGILQRILAIDPDNAAAADQLARLQASARRDKPGSVATGGDDSGPVTPDADRHDPDHGPVDVPDDRDDPSGEADGGESVGSGDPEPADDPEPSRSAGTAAAAGAGAAAAAGAAAGAGGAGTADAAPDVATPTTERVGTDRAVVDPPPDPIPDPAPTVPPVQTRQVPPTQPPATNVPRRVAAPVPAPVIPPAGTPDVAARRQPGPTPPAEKGGATPPPVPADSSRASSPWPRRIGFVLAVLFGVFAVLVVIGIIVGEEPSADPTLGPFATPQVDPPRRRWSTPPRRRWSTSPKAGFRPGTATCRPWPPLPWPCRTHLSSTAT